MKEGDIILTPLPQANGREKPRPAVLLRKMPPFGDFLVCGISSKLHQGAPGFDDWIETSDKDFNDSGLLVSSVIRLGFLTVFPKTRIAGAIGHISRERHQAILRRLSHYLLSP